MDPARAVALLNEAIARNALELVVPCDTRSTRWLLRWGSALNARRFPLPKLREFERLNDKWGFARLAQRYGLPHPPTILIRSLADLGRLEFGPPYVAKPRNGEGGVGVVVLRDTLALRRHVLAAGNAGELPLIVQAFIAGTDVDLSFLADSGRILAWTIQTRVPDEEGTFEFVADPDVLEVGATLVRAVGYHGLGHIDLRREAATGRVVAVDMNPRVWGSLPYSSWIGVNFPIRGLALAAGLDRVGPDTQVGRCPWLGAHPRSLLGLARRVYPNGTALAWSRYLATDPWPELLAWTCAHSRRLKSTMLRSVERLAASIVGRRRQSVPSPAGLGIRTKDARSAGA
jgi:biotin carboxylase